MQCGPRYDDPKIREVVHEDLTLLINTKIREVVHEDLTLLINTSFFICKVAFELVIMQRTQIFPRETARLHGTGK